MLVASIGTALTNGPQHNTDASQRLMIICQFWVIAASLSALYRGILT